MNRKINERLEIRKSDHFPGSGEMVAVLIPPNSMGLKKKKVTNGTR